MNMKSALVVLVATVLTASAATPVKRPAPTAAPKVAAKPADPRAKIEAAVRSKVSAHFKSKSRAVGSAGSGITGVSLQVTATEPMAGWPGKWRTSGTATLSIAGLGITGAAQKQTRSFSAYSTVSDTGSVEVTDVDES